jgi:hypothetical protein
VGWRIEVVALMPKCKRSRPGLPWKLGLQISIEKSREAASRSVVFDSRMFLGRSEI